jgi:hypothetical protein
LIDMAARPIARHTATAPASFAQDLIVIRFSSVWLIKLAGIFLGFGTDGSLLARTFN